MTGENKAYGGVLAFLLILLLTPNLKEALDIKIHITKQVYLSVHQIFIISDLLILFPLMYKAKIKPKLP